MRKLTFSLAAIAALCLVSVGRSLVLAQEEVKPVSQKSTTKYLFDIIPTKLNGFIPSESLLTGKWRPDKCVIDGVDYQRSVSFGGNYESGATATFSVRGYDFFDVIVGMKKQPSGRQYDTRYIILGDNDQRLLTTPTQTQDSHALRLHIPLKGLTELTLKIVGNVKSSDIWWGDARLVKDNTLPSVPKPKPGEDPEPVPPEVGKKTLQLDPEKIKELATELKTKVAKDSDLTKSKPTLALAAFQLIPANTLASANADNVREDLSTALIDTEAFEVVERGQLQKALDELKLGYKDTFDSSTAQKLGKQVGARVVMIGSISDRGEYAVINVRLIDTATGKARIAASVRLPQQDIPKKTTPDKSE